MEWICEENNVREFKGSLRSPYYSYKWGVKTPLISG